MIVVLASSCPKCGSTSFSSQRSTKAKVGGGLMFGVGALAAPKRLRCNGCGAFLKPGGKSTASSQGGLLDRIQSGAQTATAQAILTREQEVARGREVLEQTTDPAKRAEAEAKLADEEAQLEVLKRRAGVVQTGTSPAEPANGHAPLEQIRELAALHDEGAITEDEFAAKKAELLARL